MTVYSPEAVVACKLSVLSEDEAVETSFVCVLWSSIEVACVSEALGVLDFDWKLAVFETAA